MRSRRTSTLGLSLFLALGLVLAASLARAASIAIDPATKVLSCTTPACDSLDVQVLLDLGENDADSFAFDIIVTNPGIVALAPGALAGNPIAGMNGSVTLLPDGVTIRGLLDSLPVSFDGPILFDIATIPLQANAPSGVAEFRFSSAELACTTCNGGAGQIFPNGNSSNQLLATVTVVPEPGTAFLLGLGLAGLGVVRRRDDKGVH